MLFCKAFLGVSFFPAKLLKFELQLVKLRGQLLVALLVLLKEANLPFKHLNFIVVGIWAHNNIINLNLIFWNFDQILVSLDLNDILWLY